MSKDLREVLRNKLVEHFPYQEQLPEEAFCYEERPLVELAIAHKLTMWLPYYRFYRTQLTTGYEAYPFVEIIAAIHHENHHDIRLLFSPIFTPNSPAFFELFVGLRIEEREGQRQVAEAIAELLVQLLFAGKATLVSMANGRYILTLYRQNIVEYQVTVDFTEQGLLTAVRVTK